eukprot:Skav234351  [mRNA]  locus=scaffold1274:76201:77112:+ [translate_table: standard]
MKFGKQLERYKIRGWDAYYVDYNGLKKSLKAFSQGFSKYSSLSVSASTFERDASPSEGARGATARGASAPVRGAASAFNLNVPSAATAPVSALVKVSPEWLSELQSSIDRTNEFFSSVADEVESRLVAGQDELAQNKGSDFELQLRGHLQIMIVQLQSTLQDLTHFASANHTALYKILKKHDKQTGLSLSNQLMPQILRETFNEPGKVRLEALQKRLQKFADELGVENSTWAFDRGDNTMAVARISFFLGVIFMALMVLAVLSHMEPQIDQYSVEDLADSCLIAPYWLHGFHHSCFHSQADQG